MSLDGTQEVIAMLTRENARFAIELQNLGKAHNELAKWVNDLTQEIKTLHFKVENLELREKNKEDK